MLTVTFSPRQSNFSVLEGFLSQFVAQAGQTAPLAIAWSGHLSFPDNGDVVGRGAEKTSILCG